MLEEFEYKGNWWFPTKPEKKLPGTLRFIPHEEATLDLMGSFQSITEIGGELEPGIIEPETILGTANGKDITLTCFITMQEFFGSPSPSATSSSPVETVFIGAHFQKPEDIRFKLLAVHYLHLDEWVNIRGFDIERPGRNEMVIKYKQPEPIHATIGDGYQISIDVKTIQGFSRAPREVSIKQKTYIVIEPSEEKPFDEYLNVMRRIQNFLSLGTMEPVYPLAIEGITEVNKEIIEGDKAFYPPVEIYHRTLPYTPKTPRKLYQFDMLFTFKVISDRFEDFLRNWFEKADLLEPIYNLYFGTIHNPYMYLEHEFLSLTQAVESFHRRIYDGRYLPDEDYKKVYDALVNAIPDQTKDEDLRTSLKSKLEYGNEFSLRKRLKDIFSKYQEILNKFIENRKVFIDKVVETRNYLTHYDKDRKEHVSVDDLLHLTQKLKILVEICLLTELGFSSEEVKNLFAANRRYRHEFVQ